MLKLESNAGDMLNDKPGSSKENAGEVLAGGMQPKITGKVTGRKDGHLFTMINKRSLMMDFGNRIYLRPIERSTASPERESWEQQGDRMEMPKPASEMLEMMLLITISSGIWCAVGFVLGLAF